MRDVTSVFDSQEFNERLFVRRRDQSPCPPDAVDIFLPVNPTVQLHARAHLAKGARATFVVFHGNADVVADYDGLAGRYAHEVGANLVVVEYRGYGQSNGAPTFRDCIGDAPLAVRELRAQMGDRLEGPLIALGRSLGGACAAELAGLTEPLVDAVVLESAPTDVLAIVRRRGLPAPLAVSESERAVFDPQPKLGRSTLPILVLHGRDDRTIRPQEARLNFALLRHPSSRLHFIPGRDHGDVLHDDSYYEALREFVARVQATRAARPPALRPERTKPPAVLVWSSSALELGDRLKSSLGRRLRSF
jgi:pimeloyl-ACP methyl ester carboxylesterase